jgi:hypothetical protein
MFNFHLLRLLYMKKKKTLHNGKQSTCVEVFQLPVDLSEIEQATSHTYASGKKMDELLN